MCGLERHFVAPLHMNGDTESSGVKWAFISKARRPHNSRPLDPKVHEIGGILVLLPEGIRRGWKQKVALLETSRTDPAGRLWREESMHCFLGR